jgi:hypothetical protein
MHPSFPTPWSAPKNRIEMQKNAKKTSVEVNLATDRRKRRTGGVSVWRERPLGFLNGECGSHRLVVVGPVVVGHDQVSAAGSALIKGEAGVRRVSSCLY